MFTKEQLKSQMAEMGLKPTDTVLIHTSMRAIGPVEGGADGVIDAFCEYLSEGLFIVPTHTWATVSPAKPVYDVRTEKPCIGALPCAAAFRKDGVRSMNATHSVWAHGARAAQFVAGEESVYNGTAPQSCWGRLADENAKILLIGIGNERNTFIHAVEETIGVPDRTGKPFALTLVYADGSERKTIIKPHGCSKCPDVSANFPNFEKPFNALGVQSFGKLGNAEVRVVDAARCAEVVTMLWEKADYDLCVERREIPEEYYMPDKGE